MSSFISWPEPDLAREAWVECERLRVRNAREMAEERARELARKRLLWAAWVPEHHARTIGGSPSRREEADDWNWIGFPLARLDDVHDRLLIAVACGQRPTIEESTHGTSDE